MELCTISRARLAHHRSFRRRKEFHHRYVNSYRRCGVLQSHLNVGVLLCVPSVVSAEGTFYKAVFDLEKGGECVQESYAKFVKSAEE